MDVDHRYCVRLTVCRRRRVLWGALAAWVLLAAGLVVTVLMAEAGLVVGLAAFNRFPTSVTTNEWTVEGGGTALEAISGPGKEVTSTEVPATGKSLKSPLVIGKKVIGKISLPAIPGEKFTSARLHVYRKEGATEALRFGFVAPAVTKLSAAGTANAWDLIDLTTVQAEALASGGEIEWVMETAKAKAVTAYEIYLELGSAVVATPTEIPLAAASSSSAASLALTAPTKVPLEAAASGSAASAAVSAPTRVGIEPAVLSSGASAAVTAPTQVPLVAGSALSAASAALNAPTAVSLAAASSQSAGSLQASAPTSVGLSAAQSASNGTLGVSAATQVALDAAQALSGAVLALSTPTEIPLVAGVGQSAASLVLSAPARLLLDRAAGVSSSSLAVSARTLVGLDAASSAAAASMAVSAPTQIPLAPAHSDSAASLTVAVPVSLQLDPAASVAAASLVVSAPAVLLLAPGSSSSTASLALEAGEVHEREGAFAYAMTRQMVRGVGGSGSSPTVACSLQAVYGVAATPVAKR